MPQYLLKSNIYTRKEDGAIYSETPSRPQQKPYLSIKQ